MTFPTAEGPRDRARVRLVPRRAPVSTGDDSSPERELKFLIPIGRAAFLGSWLRAVCAPDTAYPPARVVTVYFDTRDLRLLDEKINSDYLKTKVRVRWYETMRGEPAGDGVFVEAKGRVGSTRQKVRMRAGLRAPEAARLALEAGVWGDLLEPLRLAGADLPEDLQPVMRLSYVRERLVDRLGSGRVASDSHIAVDAVNSRRLRPGRTGPMPGAVVEYKSRRMELPPHLRLLTDAGARRTSFSKYLAAYVYLTGTVL